MKVLTPENKPVFDNYEISPCWRVGDGAGSYDEVCDEADAQFWTLYGHITGEGVEAIGDFSSREHAEEVFYRITGQRFTGSYEFEATELTDTTIGINWEVLNCHADLIYPQPAGETIDE